MAKLLVTNDLVEFERNYQNTNDSPIKKALFQGLKNVKFKYFQDERDLIALELRFD